MQERPLVYLIQGVRGSGRWTLMRDLIEDGLSRDEQVLIFVPDSAEGAEDRERLEATANVSLCNWHLEDCKIRHDKIAAAPDTVAILSPDTFDPADMAEALKQWTQHNNCEVARIITVVHCDFLFAQPEARPWYDACIHFSDVVVLNKRTKVDNRWIKAFEQRYEKERMPCLFLLAKKDRVRNPREVTDPHARRLSLYFDELEPLEEDYLDEDDEDRPEDLGEDRYIERLVNDRRAHPVRKIEPYLEAFEG